MIKEYRVIGPSQRRNSPFRDPGPKTPEEKSAPSPRAISARSPILMEPLVTRQSSKFRIIGFQTWLAVPAPVSLINSSETNSPMLRLIIKETLLNGAPGVEIVVERAPIGSGLTRAFATA